MIDLVEELKTGDTVYIRMDNHKDLLFATYTVTESQYNGLRNHRATITLKSTPKKARYFKNTIHFEGFHITFKKSLYNYTIYDDQKDLVKDFCRQLNKTPEMNPKLFNKFKKTYPNYFK